MIKFKHHGNFKNLEKFLNRAQKMRVQSLLDQYGKKGVDVLSDATPKDSGLTSISWIYEVSQTSRGYKITWSNTNVVDGVVIAIILQYGHGTGTGGYVEGRDYINPAIRPVFDDLTTKLGEELFNL